MGRIRSCITILLLLGLSVLSAGLSGCSGPLAGDPEEKNAEPLHITAMAYLMNAGNPSETLKHLIEEKTNTRLDIQWVLDSNYDEIMEASFAAGTLPQVVYIKNQVSFQQYRDAMKSGYFWEVGHLFKDYPNLSRLRPEILQNTAVDGKVYSIYTEVPSSRQGVIYRKDWADRLGLAAPATVEELYRMMKAFAKDDPDNNGLADTIGLADRSDLVFGAFKTVSSYFGTPNNWGLTKEGLQPEFLFPGYRDTMDFFRKLYQEKLINRDFTIMSKNDQINLFITGKAGMYIGSIEDVQTFYRKLAAEEPSAVLDVQNRIQGPRGTGVWGLPGYISAVVFPKSSVRSEQELRAILGFFDHMMEPEMANLVTYGLEGTHYSLVEGKVLSSDNRLLLEKEVIPFATLLKRGSAQDTGILEPYFALPVRQKAARLVKDNEAIAIHDPTAALDSKTFAEKGTRLADLIRDATYAYILEDAGDAGFTEAVERWRQEGGNSMIAEYNEAYRLQQAGGAASR
ncbi:MAG: extracellular solute-binding protein family 1 [Paenibacillaceae bacterium]|jgi:putative aldouronate transport system substrate-binding protein|nr:extracellular solute-binding protein family 1 [Paenibacillaceae bacterium]